MKRKPILQLQTNYRRMPLWQINLNFNKDYITQLAESFIQEQPCGNKCPTMNPCSPRKVMRLLSDPTAIHEAPLRDILPALQAQLQSDTPDKPSLTLAIKAVLEHPVLLDDCILVCGLLCHKHGIVIDGVGDELRRLWLQVALTRAKLQDGTPIDSLCYWNSSRGHYHWMNTY